MADTVNTQPITIVRGQEFLADIMPAVPVPVLGWTTRFRIFRHEGATPSITLVSGQGGLAVVDEGVGVYRVHLTPDQTAGIPTGEHRWDLEPIAGTEPFQMAGGPVTVVDDSACGTPANLVCPSPLYTPSIGKLFGNIFKGQRPTAVIPSGSPAAIKVALYTPDGRPAIVQAGNGSSPGYCGPADVLAGFGEAVCGAPTCARGSLSEDGMFVIVEVPDEIWCCPGVYELDVRASDSEGAARALGRAIVYVETNAFGGWRGGPPLVDDVRVAVRDYPAANRLLGDYEFSTTEIAVAVVMAIRNFNAAPPDSIPLVTTRTWPRDAWDNLIDGVMAELFDTAAAYYRRGHLPYSAAGVSIDDMAKEDEYLKAAFVHRDRWQRWVKLIKMGANIEGGFASLHSDYSLVGGW